MISIPSPPHHTLPILAEKFYQFVKGPLIRKIMAHRRILSKYEDSAGISFYNFLTQQDPAGNYVNLRRIIASPPGELNNVISEISTYNLSLKKIHSVNRKRITLCGLLQRIFFYSSYDVWEAYRHASSLNLNVCVYCNRQYISTVGNDKDKGSRCEFDHFFSQSAHPCLSLSFYNLIPSCKVCNSSLKSSSELTYGEYIHPFDEGFGDDAAFSSLPSSFEELAGDNEPGICIHVYATGERKRKIDNSISLFMLEKHYHVHRDYVKELIETRDIAGEDYIYFLMKQYPDAFATAEDAYLFAFRNYFQENDFCKRPLSKLTRDIVEELGMFTG